MLKLLCWGVFCYYCFMENLQPPQTATDYITLFRQLAAITNKAMDYLENNKPIQVASLERIAQNVETLASLRGDSSIYNATRPEGLVEHQKEMYAIEDQLRNRLINLGYKHPAPRSLSETV